MSYAPSSLDSVVQSEFRSYSPSLGTSRLVYNVLSVVPIGHASRSRSKSIMPNTFISLIPNEFPIFHGSAIRYVSPSYIPSNGIITAPSKLPSQAISSRPSVMPSEEPLIYQSINPT